MIRLIASDMDGTLLGATMGISEGNLAAIREAESHGITFMAATGRGYSEAEPVLTEHGIHCAMINVNGSQAFDKDGNLLFTIGLSKETAAEIISILGQHRVYFEVATNKGTFSDSRPQRIENAANHLTGHFPDLSFKMAVAMSAAHLDLLQITYIDTYEEILTDDSIEILKFIVFSEEGPVVLDPARAEIEKINDLVITSSHVNNIEINHIDAQKGHAVERIAKSLGIPMEQVLTIGDNFNDVSMLKVGGVSFAMGNAEPGVKAVAKYVTDTNIEDGVGKAILRAINENL